MPGLAAQAQIAPWAAAIAIATLMSLIPIGIAGSLLGLLVIPVGVTAAAIAQGMWSPPASSPRS